MLFRGLNSLFHLVSYVGLDHSVESCSHFCLNAVSSARGVRVVEPSFHFISWTNVMKSSLSFCKLCRFSLFQKCHFFIDYLVVAKAVVLSRIQRGFKRVLFDPLHVPVFKYPMKMK